MVLKCNLWKVHYSILNNIQVIDSSLSLIDCFLFDFLKKKTFGSQWDFNLGRLMRRFVFVLQHLGNMKVYFLVKPIHGKVLRGSKLVLPIKLAFVREGGFKKNSQCIYHRFRCSEEVLISTNNGNFWVLFELLAKMYSILNRLLGVNPQKSYLGNTIENELI